MNAVGFEAKFLDKVQAACPCVAPLWPLTSFVAVNPYLGLHQQSFLAGPHNPYTNHRPGLMHASPLLSRASSRRTHHPHRYRRGVTRAGRLLVDVCL